LYSGKFGKPIKGQFTEVINTTSIIHLHRNSEVLATLFTPSTKDDITVLVLAALTEIFFDDAPGSSSQQKTKEKKK
jgi:hypothetical protein